MSSYLERSMNLIRSLLAIGSVENDGGPGNSAAGHHKKDPEATGTGSTANDTKREKTDKNPIQYSSDRDTIGQELVYQGMKLVIQGHLMSLDAQEPLGDDEKWTKKHLQQCLDHLLRKELQPSGDAFSIQDFQQEPTAPTGPTVTTHPPPPPPDEDGMQKDPNDEGLMLTTVWVRSSNT